MKSKQFCSVCKEWLEMEVVPTGDGDDDGVIWFRCPQCQGFLPKLSAGDPAADDSSAGTTDEEVAATTSDDDMPFDSPAEMMAARDAAGEAAVSDIPDIPLDVTDVDLPELAAEEIPATGGDEDSPRPRASKSTEPAEPAEPIAEYAAQLEAALSDLPADQTGGRPYRPWEAYEVGTCIQHLAWEDCGIVVAKEDLPGGRRVIKVFFQEAGVVRLIEQAPK